MLARVRGYRQLRYLKKFAYVLIVVVKFPLSSCENVQTTASKYGLYIDRAVEIWQFQGSYLMAKVDSVIAQGSCGYADLDKRLKTTPKIKFLIGSITKSLTAIATLQLIEDGLLDLNQSIREYIGNYSLNFGDIRHVLIQHVKLIVKSSVWAVRLLLQEKKNRFYFAHDQMTTFRFL